MTLLLAQPLLLPWIAGCLVLLAYYQTQSKHNTVVGLSFYLSVGGLFGYVILFALIQLNLVIHETLPVTQIQQQLLIISVVSLLVVFKRSHHSKTLNITQSTHTPSLVMMIAISGLLFIIFCHIYIAMLELLSYPTYAWDAVSTWSYRAKVWFHSGQINTFVSLSDWLQSDNPELYTIQAYQYPNFVSLMQLWLALNIDQWHESLIHLPAFQVGLFTVLGVYAFARKFGYSRLTSLLCSTALISMPMFHNHLAIGGYADIWMSAYIGMGLISLMLFLHDNQSADLVLALILLLTALSIKVEATAWLIMAIFLILFHQRIWPGLLVLGLLLSAIAAREYLPSNSLHEVSDGWLSYLRSGLQFESHDASTAFFNNLFVYDNWHLLGIITCFAAIVSVASPLKKHQKIAVNLLILITISLIFLFFFTSSGNWAADYTAINRILLQFIPAIVFALMLILGHYSRERSQIKTRQH